MTSMPLSRIPPELFRFTSGDRAQLYGAILSAFAEANERLETALVLDDVRMRVGAAVSSQARGRS